MATKKTHWDDLEIDPVIILCAVETYAILKGIGCGTPLRSDSDYMASIGCRPSILYLKYDQENLTKPKRIGFGWWFKTACPALPRECFENRRLRKRSKRVVGS
jgi:hypothetical protein